MDESELIRHQMEETRSSLTDKLETLENQVVETVQGTTTAVAETVENVKEAVQDTVDQVTHTVQDTVTAVKNSINIARQVDRHPWPMLGGSVALGFILGRLLTRTRAESTSSGKTGSRSHGNGFSRKLSHSSGSQETPASSSGAGLLSGLGKTLGPELDKLKGLALGTVGGMVRDLVTKSAPPQLGDKLGHLVDDLTTKLGGEIVPAGAMDSASPGGFDAGGQNPGDLHRASKSAGSLS